MRERYRQAHREARTNRRAGLWIRNPVRVVDGWPGVFVGADGRPRFFAGFGLAPDLFRVWHGGE